MRILMITGDHPRHLFYLTSIHERFPLCGVISMKREDFIPKPPKETSAHDKKNFNRHFKDRAEAEKRFFGRSNFPAGLERLVVTPENLNSKKTADFVRRLSPEVVLVFGSGLLRQPLLSALPKTTLNLHLGLSPKYRGDATLFWPFYFLEPNFSGFTLHFLTDKPDAGDIVHQGVPVLKKKDRIHDVACKVLVKAAEDTERLLELLTAKKPLKRITQKQDGKNFKSADFKPEHLRVIYDLFGGEMVSEYLSGRLKAGSPRLVQQF